MTPSEPTMRERLDRIERALEGLEASRDAAVRTYAEMVRVETTNLRYLLLADEEEA